MAMTVLVIDDSTIILESTRAILEEAGYRVLTHAESIGTAVIVRREKPDAVLLDVSMPAMPGDQLAQVIRKAAPGEPPKIVLFSARDEEDLSALGEACGAVGVITKGDDNDAFVRRFSALVGAP